jgi:hypothetical protein
MSEQLSECPLSLVVVNENTRVAGIFSGAFMEGAPSHCMPMHVRICSMKSLRPNQVDLLHEHEGDWTKLLVVVVEFTRAAGLSAAARLWMEEKPHAYVYCWTDVEYATIREGMDMNNVHALVNVQALDSPRARHGLWGRIMLKAYAASRYPEQDAMGLRHLTKH